MHQIIGALQHLKKSKISWENAIDGVSPYKIVYCKPVTLLNKVSVKDYRFLILKAVPKDYFCLQNLERFSQKIYRQFFLKLLLCKTKMIGKNKIQLNRN